MKVAVVGTGYVGLVTGTCFAETGNQVTCIDIDENKIKKLREGVVPIYEPGLEVLFERNVKQGRLEFTTQLSDGIKEANVIFLALPTPSGADGSADLQYVLRVAEDLGALLEDYAVIVDKSTVPVGTAEKVREKIAQKAQVPFDVVSNPEFLREGVAVDDFMKPERVVIGSSSERAQKVMQRLYEPLVRQGNPVLLMDEKSAELTKYAANSFLATKISFMNEIANLCELLGADVDAVRKGMGTDSRIGKRFLFAGIGYGGSCFPKDVQALGKSSNDVDYEFKILNAVMDTNLRQKTRLMQKLESYYNGTLKGKTFAMWGLAFKPYTDDIREAPSLYNIDKLHEAGVKLKVYDPEAMNNVQAYYKGKPQEESLTFCNDEYEAVKDADGLLIMTEWPEFRTPDFDKLASSLNQNIIFDGRNLYTPEYMQELGFSYFSIGRKDINSNGK